MKNKLVRVSIMKLKAINDVSAACFFLSSASLLFIPFLKLEESFTNLAFFLALIFWLGLFTGTALQIFLWIKSRKLAIQKNLKKPKLMVAVIFAISILSGVLALCFFETNMYALPIDLFAVLLSAEMFCIIKRMERLI